MQKKIENVYAVFKNVIITVTLIAVTSKCMPGSVHSCLFQLNLNATGIGLCAYCD